MLQKIPNIKLEVIERCSGHGGSWGCFKNNFDTALKVGKPVVRQVVSQAKESKENVLVSSECPLAGAHIIQGVQKMQEENTKVIEKSRHPIEVLAAAYNFSYE